MSYLGFGGRGLLATTCGAAGAFVFRAPRREEQGTCNRGLASTAPEEARPLLAIESYDESVSPKP